MVNGQRGVALEKKPEGKSNTASYRAERKEGLPAGCPAEVFQLGRRWAVPVGLWGRRI